jgi:hypothetical protein
VKHRETIEVIVGAVTGSLKHPELVVCGLYRGRDLEIVGRTVPLTTTQAAELAATLYTADRDRCLSRQRCTRRATGIRLWTTQRVVSRPADRC